MDGAVEARVSWKGPVADPGRESADAVRRRWIYLRPLLDYLGALFWVFGFVLLVPLVVLVVNRGRGMPEMPPSSFLVPAGLAFLLGVLLKRRLAFLPLDGRRAMLFCAIAWLAVSALAALPFSMGLPSLGFKGSYLDGYFESVSGFTTTGITMYSGLDRMPRSIIFWRALMQWLGGLGILTFFLVIAASSGSAHNLFSAESHKIFSRRPAPGLFRTVRILWLIYIVLTFVTVAVLCLLDMSLFDAIAHAFTALSTGGYSPYDASIAHYAQAGYPHAAAIEYVLVVAMLLGGMNFFVHYRWLTGDLRSLLDNVEVRWWWAFVFGATGLVALDRVWHGGASLGEPLFRDCLFQVSSIVTTTGFATQDIATSWAPALAKLVFLVLMVVGGCVGSTGGGIKVLRVAILWRMLKRQVVQVIHGRHAVLPIRVDGEVIDVSELRRIAALFFAWMALLAIGSGVTALFSNLGALEAASGMFSALGNIGPCYISVADMGSIHPIVKIVYILGMLAGRLEILPIMLLFSRRAWR